MASPTSLTFKSVSDAVAEDVRTVAQWHAAEWAYLHPGEDTPAHCEERLRARVATILAFDGDEDGVVVGSVSIDEADMATRPWLSPWLAGLYVRADRRGRGIGAALIARALGEAKRLGLRQLFLFTPDAEA